MDINQYGRKEQAHFLLINWSVQERPKFPFLSLVFDSVNYKVETFDNKHKDQARTASSARDFKSRERSYGVNSSGEVATPVFQYKLRHSSSTSYFLLLIVKKNPPETSMPNFSSPCLP